MQAAGSNLLTKCDTSRARKMNMMLPVAFLLLCASCCALGQVDDFQNEDYVDDHLEDLGLGMVSVCFD